MILKRQLYLLPFTGFLLLLFATLSPQLIAQTTTYYVSSSTGNDANDGLSEATPWQTFAKVNSVVFPDNAHILFKRNDVFRGELSLMKFPVGILFSAYGTGDNPVFAGSVVITGWTPTTRSGLSSQVYEANVATLPPLGDKGIQHLFVNGELMTIARYPNVDSPATKNWLKVGASAGKDSFTDPALVAYGKPDDYWKGAKLRIRNYSWTFTVSEITNYTAANGKITASQLGNQLPEWGYFIDGKLEELDSPGEWFYDATAKKVYLYPKAGVVLDSALVEGATYEVGLNVSGQENNTVIDGLTFRHYLFRGVFIGTSDNVTLRNNRLEHNFVGVYVSDPTNVLVIGNTFDHQLKDSIVLQAQDKFDVQNSVVEQNVITNTAMYPTYGVQDEGVYGGIGIAMFGQAFTARQNTIENVSWNGIYLKDGGHHIVEHNVIRKALIILNDGGAIAISSDGNVIRGNFLLESVGNVDESNGCMSPNQTPCGHHSAYGMGVGADNNKQGNVIEDNVVANNTDLGIRLNAYTNTIVKNNVLYNNEKQIFLEDIHGPSANNQVENNIMFPLHPDHLGLSLTLDNASTKHGTFDNNYYCHPFSNIVVKRGIQPYSLAHWQSEFPEYDPHSKQCDFPLQEYTTTSLGANLIVNSTFDADVSNWSDSGTATISTEVALLNGNSLKMVAKGKGNANVVSNSFSLTANQTYLLKFSILGNGFGNLQMRLNEAVTGQASQILAERYFAYDMQRRDYEMVLTSPITTTAGKFLFITDETSANTYWLDNVSFEPVTATRNDVTQQVTLFSNPTAVQTTVTLTKKYVDLVNGGQEVGSSLTLEPFTAKILVSNDTTPVVPSASVVLTTAKAGNGTGILTSSAGLGAGIQCGATCTATYNPGSVVTLTATPDAGSTFTGWSGAGCADTLTLTANLTCTANFALATTPKMTLTVNNVGGGKVSSTPVGIECGTQCTYDYPQGTVVTLLATPEATSSFTSWTGGCTGTTNPTTVTLDAAKTCTATFGLSTTAEGMLTLNLTKAGNGTVTDSLGQLSCGDTCVTQYPTATVVTLTATPAVGNQFDGFTGDADCNDGQVTIDKNSVHCVATFKATSTPAPTFIPLPANIALATCPTKGTINEMCRGNGQTITVTIGKSGLVSDAVLAGSIDSQGWISNVTIATKATLTGGTVTGYITNQGTMADFRFVGASIKGGTLAGEVVNDSKVGGTFIDVTLAPNTHITGGKLQGTITGDATAPALLDNVLIVTGSDVSDVELGDNVVVEEGAVVKEVITEEDVTTTPTPPTEEDNTTPPTEEDNTTPPVEEDNTTPPPVEEVTLPKLGNGEAMNANGEEVITASQFAGGIAVNEEKVFQTSQEIKTSDAVEVIGQITVSLADIGETADIFVCATYQPQQGEPGHYCLDSHGVIQQWDQKPTTLEPFQQDVSLQGTQPVEMFKGTLQPLVGNYQIYFGYRLPDGTIVENADAMEVTITE